MKSSKKLQTQKQYNFIVIGSGLAGLLSAHYLSKKGSVLLITKKKLPDCSTNYAQGGIAAAVGKDDSINEHIADTLKVGHFINNSKTVKFIIQNGPAAIQELIKLGTDFTKENGQLSLHLEGGHSHKRVVHSYDHTGANIEKALITNIKNNPRIKIYENTIVKDLILNKGKCTGIIALKNNKFEAIFSGATILCTGGIGQVYSKTANPLVTTGDGIAIASRAKAKISNMEFVQFHPTTLDVKSSPLFLLTEALRGEGGKLMNSKKEYFMAKYHLLKDLAGRDIISQAIFEESKKGQVYLDLRQLNQKQLKTKYPTIYQKLLNNKINPAQKPIPISPATHFICGGITTNLKNATSIKNLYAIGETADNGFHGANRLASNSLLECTVMPGQIKNLKAINPQVQDAKIPAFKKQPLTLNLRKRIQKIMWQKVGIKRNPHDLKAAIIELNKIKKQLPTPTDFQSIETSNILECGLLIAKSALQRKKSIGCHFMETNHTN